MKIEKHRRHRLLIKERNSLGAVQCDRGPNQLEFALQQKQEIEGPEHMLSHLVEHQCHLPKPKTVLLKNS